MTSDTAQLVRNFRGAFAGCVIGSKAWLLTVMYHLSRTQETGGAIAVVAISLLIGLGLDWLIWCRFMQQHQLPTRPQFLVAAIKVPGVACLIAVALAVVCGKTLQQSGIESPLWLLPIAIILIAFLFLQYSLAGWASAGRTKA